MTEPPAGGPEPTARAPLHTCATDDPERVLYELALDLGSTSSTATAYDPWTHQLRPLGPAQTAALAGHLAELLERPDWPASDLGARSIPDTVAEDVAGRLAPQQRGRLAEGATAANLAAQLLADRDAELRLADNLHRVEDQVNRLDREARMAATVRALEATLTDFDLDSWLPGKLHAAHGAAARALSLASFRLTRVLLEDGEPEVASVLYVPVDGGVREARLQSWQEEKATPYRGLKRRLARPEPVPEPLGELPEGWPADTDLLIATAYADLVRRIEAFLAEAPAALRGRGVVQLTATVPTVTPPAARRRLRRLLQAALRRVLADGQVADVRVDVSYDEGVAAALFFVMRELGSADEERGVERMRSASRRLDERSWQRILLVVDIGGGTTDIALITIDLEEVTRAPGDATAGTLWNGRHYVLRPRVLGTTGHAQLGGDLLTLRVLYWIKARIVDALAERTDTGSPADGTTMRARLHEFWARQVGPDAEVPERLAPLVVGFRDPGPAPIDVREALRALVPTHADEAPTPGGRPGAGAGSSAPTNDFLLLLREAERAKRALAAGKPYEIRAQTLMDMSSAELTALAEQGDPLVLAPAEFATLARPLLDAATGLAGRLARRHLGRTDHRRLDGVALAGRTCGMPQAAEVARDTIGRILFDPTHGAAPVIWDRAALDVEALYAKQAASIGAAWASYHRSNRPNLAEALADGSSRTRVHVAVQSLLLDLPCGFDIGDATEQGTVIFEPGRRLDRAFADGTLYVESESRPLQAQIRLERRRDGASVIQWGHFDYVDQRLREGLGRADPAAADHRLPSGVTFRVRLDQQLEPTLLVRSGPIDRLRVVPVQQPRQLRLGPPPTAGGELPSIGVERVGVEGERAGTVPVFGPAAGRPRFDALVHVGSAADRHGAVSAVPLPGSGADVEPGTRGPITYRLWAGEDAGQDLGTFTVGPAPDGGYWLVLDATGNLSVTEGYPPYLRAASLHEMEHSPGTVFVAALTDSIPDWDPWWEPFNGWH